MTPIAGLPKPPCVFFIAMVMPKSQLRILLVARDFMVANGASDVEAVELSTMASHEECVAPTIVATLAYFNSFATTSTKVVELRPKLSLYPNPAAEWLHVVNLERPAKARIF